jgi:glycosyltransferase involved in cell wall biosynthesis
MASPRILIDVESAKNSAFRWRPPTGIQRVEVCLAEALAQRGHHPVVWDEHEKSYRSIDIAIVDKLLSESTLSLDEILGLPRDPASLHSTETARVRLRILTLRLRPKLGRRRELLMDSVAQDFGLTATAFPQWERRLLARLLGLHSRVARRFRFILGARLAPLGVRDWYGPLLAYRSGDILLLPTTWWITPAQAHFPTIAAAGVKIVPVIYDLYQLRNPQFMSDAAVVSRKFGDALRQLTKICKLAITISRWTADDLAAWCRENALQAPPIEPIALTAGLRPRAEWPSVMPAEFPYAQNRFVLMPGSFGPIKNQTWAYMLWTRLRERLGDSTWPIVFVGHRGMRHQIVDQITADPGYGRQFLIVNAPTDAELAWLYGNCAFVIQPSEVEGWGLNVSEALVFGKPCLTSGRGGTAEAGFGLAWMCDPIDGQAWVERIARLMTDPAFLASEQARVRNNLPARDWSDVADDIERCLGAHAATPRA